MRRTILTAALALALAATGAASPWAGRALAQAAVPQEGAGSQRAASAVTTEILVVLASEAEGAIDPALSEMPALRRPPFNAFHTMQVLTRTERPLAQGAPIDLTLPNGRQLRIELERTTSDGRFRVRVSINTPGQSDYLPLLSVVASPGDPFFIAGQNHQVGALAGTLVIGVRVGQRPAGAAAAAPRRRKV